MQDQFVAAAIIFGGLTALPVAVRVCVELFDRLPAPQTPPHPPPIKMRPEHPVPL